VKSNGLAVCAVLSGRITSLLICQIDNTIQLLNRIILLHRCIYIFWSV